MAALIGMPRAAWKRQPQGVVSVHTGNPLADRLFSSVIPLFGIAFDPARNLALPSNVRFSTSRYGQVFNFSGSQYIPLLFAEGFAGRLLLNSEYSICVLFRTSIATTTRQAILGDWSSGGGLNSHSIEFSGYEITSGNIGASKPSGSAEGSFFNGTPGSTGVWYFAALSFSFSSSMMMIINVDNNQLLYKESKEARTGNDGINAAIGRGGDYNSLYLTGQVGYFFGYRRALLENEIIELAINPWQLFKPRIARFISIPSSAPVTRSAALIGMPRAAWKRQPQGILQPDDQYRYSGSLFFNASCHEGIGFDYTEVGTVKRASYSSGIGVSSETTSSYIRTIRPFQVITGFHTVVVACMALDSTKRYVSGTVDADTTYIEDIVLNSELETTSAGKIEIFLRSENSTALRANTSAIFSAGSLLYFAFKVNSSGLFELAFHGKNQNLNYTSNTPHTYINQLTDYPLVLLNRNARDSLNDGTNVVLYAYARIPQNLDIQSLSENPWQLFKSRIARFISIPSSGPVIFQPAWARLRSLIIGSGV